MYACLFADLAVQQMSTAWLVKYEVELRSRVQSYFKEFGFHLIQGCSLRW
jgi:hypothetical protein